MSDVGASAKAIRHHYDLSNEFYRVLLGDTFVYSCGRWQAGDSLESAQIQKIDYMASLARVEANTRVLDVGCGWGTGLRRLVETHLVARAVGLTLSDAQADWIRAQRWPRTVVAVESWANHHPLTTYDSLISIGAFEHFARPGQNREARFQQYRSFFRVAHRILRPQGSVGLQTMAVGNARLRRGDAQILRFLSREIFPESALPRLAEILKATEGLFELRTAENDRASYALTCRAWLKNLEDGRARAEDLVGVHQVDRYRRYLEGVIPMFENGQVVLMRFSMERV